MGYTKGPWSIDQTGKYYTPCIRRNGIVICMLHESIAGIDNQEQESNAALIAAAPDLLEACKRLLSALQSDAKISPNMPVIISLETNHAAIIQAHNAIAKAEGR
jgi:hypothetical protein